MKHQLLPGEYWYGGNVYDGIRQPVGAEDDRTFRMERNETPNQSMPFFVSSAGRYLWREDGYSIHFSGGEFECPPDVLLSEGHGNLRGAYLAGMRRHFPFHKIRLPKKLFDTPVYNTWIELTYYQEQEAVLGYAREILAHGLEPGVLMIDDGWNECYGGWNFHRGRFPDPEGMIRELKSMGFSIMLWVCPFVSPDSMAFRDALGRGILMMEPETVFAGNTDSAEGMKSAMERVFLARWWNGCSAVLDMEKPEAAVWLDEQLKALMDMGVDGFKFDAGDSIYYPSSGNLSPNEYSRLWAAYGEKYDLNEYRVCWKNAGYSLFQRLCDKDHSWGEKGVKALIPDTLIQGLTGHPFCCPDMVGGGEYLSFRQESLAGLDGEIFLRHSEIACMMPSIQFSAAPWRVLNDAGFSEVKGQLKVRKTWRDYRMEVLSHAMETGEPMVRPMEYEFPGQGLEQVMDQFMLGEKLLVAPRYHKGESGREVSLPKGQWRYGDRLFKGGQRIRVEAKGYGPLLFWQIP